MTSTKNFQVPQCLGAAAVQRALRVWCSCSKPWTYPKIWAKNYNIVQVKHYGPLHNKPGALGEWLTDHASE